MQIKPTRVIHNLSASFDDCRAIISPLGKIETIFSRRLAVADIWPRPAKF